jgi:lysophospholipase L1-like esterase
MDSDKIHSMKAHQKTILFLGHSLIEFFDWQGRFPGHRVFNLGVAGETAEGLLSRTERIITEHPGAELIFIMTGINDVAMEEFDFIGSYRKIIEKLKAAYPEARIFIHSLLPVTLEWVTDEAIREANRSIEACSKETNAELIDLYALFLDERRRAREDLFLPDGVHLTEKGYSVWAKAIEGIIE